jgi:hypothetical protein
MARRYVPARGDAVWITLNPQLDTSKPAVVLPWFFLLLHTMGRSD